MADYYRVKIGTIYLTDDGTVDGDPCRCEVQGLDALKPAYNGPIIKAADGTPHVFPLPNLGRGAEIAILPFAIRADVYDDVCAAVNALTPGQAINVTIEGDTGSFDLECKPNGPRAIQFPGTFSSGIIDSVSFNFIVSGVN